MGKGRERRIWRGEGERMTGRQGEREREIERESESQGKRRARERERKGER